MGHLLLDARRRGRRFHQAHVRRRKRNMLDVLAAVAGKDYEDRRRRQAQGQAKAEGKYKGRIPSARRKAGDVQRMLAQGLAPTEIGRRLGISRASVYRIVRANGVKGLAV